MKECNEFSLILMPSPIGGIGVFAVHDIDKGTEVLTRSFNPRIMKIKEVPEALLKYCIFLNSEDCKCPEKFNRMEIGWYVNHSHTPNISRTNDKVVANRDIKAGEEILLDYNELNEPEHLKEDYYKKS